MSMQISGASSVASVNKRYDNPVNKKWEYYSAALPGAVGAIVVGGLAGTATKYGLKKSTKLSAGAGIGTGLAVALWTLPTALYHKSVEVFGKEKEMDVYSRAKTAEIKIAENLDKSIEDTNLDDSINRFYKYSMAKTGKGMPIVNIEA